MRIYTRGGDRGETSLAGGARRPKEDPRVEAYGSLDEAGAFIGLAAAQLDSARDADVRAALEALQHMLWDAGSDLARPERGAAPWRTQAHYAGLLEEAIDRFDAQLPPLQRFILRGGCAAAAHLHVACTVVRRAERRISALSRQGTVNPHVLAVVNRASDLLFVLARLVNARSGQGDVFYEPQRFAPPQPAAGELHAGATASPNDADRRPDARAGEGAQ